MLVLDRPSYELGSQDKESVCYDIWIALVHPYLTTESAVGEALYFSINLPSPKEPSPGVAAFIGFAAEAKPVPEYPLATPSGERKG